MKPSLLQSINNNQCLFFFFVLIPTVFPVLLLLHHVGMVRFVVPREAHPSAGRQRHICFDDFELRVLSVSNT